ncbi:hypothetical protein A5886_002628 [Enterococcus sp. 8G7_MSG3316]|uniref:histidine kinase n=1 Tax=Candidatus Enterococcus testudinis TaxID=1834191 RepID=A0A242A921_9ENTE|nr:HAMP domain-containing sensor histidine kinase [Enterococcus sp. 8G7_MSG3316]OTN77528.1 hypothetical protein A5886_002628 [Enterococcus sp. 8G7_MSG3316]
MKPPSKFWLYAIVCFTFCLTIAGVIFTYTSYHKAQDQAITMGKKQLRMINQSAIKLISHSIEAYQSALSMYVDDYIEDTNSLTLKPAVLLPSLTNNKSAAVGLYLIDQEQHILSQVFFQDDTQSEQTALTKKIIDDIASNNVFADQDIQNGSVFFAGQESYLNLYSTFIFDDTPLTLAMPIQLQTLYREDFANDSGLSGYTMVKDQAMEIVMHPSDEQIGLSIVDDRYDKFPNLDFTDLRRLENDQRQHEKGTAMYYSYWWNQDVPQKVLKLSAYEWFSVGNTRLIVASNSDYYERNGLLLQDSLILIGLLVFLLIIIVLLTFFIRNYIKRNRIFIEYKELQSRQQLLKEKHEIEKAMIQESKLETIGVLTTTIVHDMNNFLTPMIGHLQLLIDEHKDDPALVDDLHEVYHAAEKGKELSTNVLRFSKIDSHQKTKTSITETLQEAVTTIRRLLPKRISIDLDLREVGYGLFDAVDLQVIIYNLLMNVYQANANCVIRLSHYTYLVNFQFSDIPHSMKNKRIALIEIADNGPGIPEAMQKKIFTRFFTTKSASGGTGLGLFTVASIVKKNDWLIELRSDSKGTTFYLGIPIDSDE